MNNKHPINLFNDQISSQIANRPQPLTRSLAIQRRTSNTSCACTITTAAQRCLKRSVCRAYKPIKASRWHQKPAAVQQHGKSPSPSFNLYLTPHSKTIAMQIYNYPHSAPPYYHHRTVHLHRFLRQFVPFIFVCC